MQLQAVDRVEAITPEDFRNQYYNTKKPLIITGLEGVRPCTLAYLPVSIISLLKRRLPLRKLKPSIKSVIPIMASAPTLVSFEIFTIALFSFCLGIFQFNADHHRATNLPNRIRINNI